MSDPKGIVGSLLDFSFKEFVTPKILKFLYILGIALVGLEALAILVWGLSSGVSSGILSLIIAPLYFVIAVIVIRVLLEMTQVLFSIEVNTRRLAAGETADIPAPTVEAEQKAAVKKDSKKKSPEKKDAGASKKQEEAKEDTGDSDKENDDENKEED